MTLRYLLDENVDTALLAALRQHAPDLVVWRIGDPGTPPFGTLDPAVLLWCEQFDFILVTNNRRSMPTHLAGHLATDRHIPGIFLINASLGFSEILEYLILAAAVAAPDEYRDQIQHLSSL